ncbi:MAG: putative quinol monooxygenase [Clostridium sp.]
MVKVVAKCTVKAECIDEYIKISKELVEETQKEEGCIFYSLHQDVNDKSVFACIETWESQEALDAHLQSAHIKRIVPKLRQMRISSEMNVYKDLFEA